NKYRTGTVATPNTTAGSRRLQECSPKVPMDKWARTEKSVCWLLLGNVVTICHRDERTLSCNVSISSYQSPPFKPGSRKSSARPVTAVSHPHGTSSVGRGVGLPVVATCDFAAVVKVMSGGTRADSKLLSMDLATAMRER